MRSLLKASVLAATLGGCVASAGVGYQPAYVAPPPAYAEPAPAYDAEPAVEVAYVEPTSYVYVNPQVQVIEDYDYPVFFSSNLYWRFEGGVWYSSSYHDRGWAASYDVPVYVRNIDRPTQYVHYHANANASFGQPGSRYVPPAPIHHPNPPPRYVSQPGHAAPVAPSHGGQPPRNIVDPMHGPGPGHEPPGHTGPTRGETEPPTREPVRSTPTRGETNQPTPPMHEPPVHSGPTRGETTTPPPMHEPPVHSGPTRGETTTPPVREPLRSNPTRGENNLPTPPPSHAAPAHTEAPKSPPPPPPHKKKP